MISATNYFNNIDLIGVKDLPATLKKSHDFVVKSTNNGESWNVYENNDTVRKVIDLYFQKLDEYLSSKDSGVLFKVKPDGKTKILKADNINFSRRTPAKPIKKVASKKKSQKDEKKVHEDGELIRRTEHIREEVKFIRRFIRLHNKIKSPESILSIIKSLQRSIVQKLIRKTSPLADEIRLIQDKLVKAYNNSNGKDQRIEVNENDLPRLVSIAGGEEVYPSISIIKRYIGLQGKVIDSSKIESFKKAIKNALEKKKVAGDDPYYDKVKAIYNSIRRLKGGSVVKTAQTELNGLAGILAGCACKNSLGKIYRSSSRLRRCKKGTYSDSKGKGTCSHNRGLNGVLTAEEMATRELDLLDFRSVWLSLLGRPAKNFTAMFHGEPFNGKTIFLLKLAQYLAEKFGNVLYVSSEEFASPTMTKKVSEFLNPFPERLHFAENLKDPDLSLYQFIILDSVNDLGLKINDYKAIRKEYPDPAIIFILQHTKSGEFKGGKDWEHTAEIVGEVSKGTVTITKNRYAQKTVFDFFRHLGIQWTEPQNTLAPGPYLLTGDNTHY